MANDETNQKVSAGEAIVNVLWKNRKPLIGTVVCLAVLIIGFVATLGIRDAMQVRAISRVEALNDRYESLRFDIADPEKDGDVQALLDDLTANAKKSFGYSSARSYSLVAAIHADRKNWEEAEQTWALAATKGAKTYLAPVFLFNAAAAAEEYGNLDKAIEYYRQTIAAAADFPSADFPSAARAQFSIGRLLEAQADREGALEAYRELIEKWPSETIWTNFANSRILALSGLTS
ncbi:hypothetical protein FACS189483_11270 [Spirochaetia bacterium]|nr:hypothetical protein FACS189483_11270 [Spirochaetia bacterium]